jgi:hypothetical protein
LGGLLPPHLALVYARFGLILGNILKKRDMTFDGRDYMAIPVMVII